MNQCLISTTPRRAVWELEVIQSQIQTFAHVLREMAHDSLDLRAIVEIAPRNIQDEDEEEDYYLKVRVTMLSAEDTGNDMDEDPPDPFSSTGNLECSEILISLVARLSELEMLTIPPKKEAARVVESVG